MGSEFSFVWRIENFSFHMYMEEPVCFISPNFTYSKYKDCCLTFHPKSYYVTFSNCSLRNRTLELECQLQIGTDITKKKLCRIDSNRSEIKVDFKPIMYYTCNDCLIIKFSIWNIKRSPLNFNYCFAQGGVEVDKFQLIWNVTEFSSCSGTSKFFTIPEFGKCKLCLRKEDNHICITIRLVSNSAPNNIPFRSEIIILGLEGRKWKSDPKLHVFEKVGEAIEFPRIKISYLIIENFLKYNKLSLCCNFAISTKKFISSIKCYQSNKLNFCYPISDLNAFTLSTDEYCSPLRFNQHNDKVGTTQAIDTVSSIDSKLAINMDDHWGNDNSNVDILCGDLQRMYIDKKMADVVFQVGEKALPAHKVVLAARSPVFMAMFEQDMSENKSGIIDISDIEYSTLESMLLFMYGGKLQDVSFENVVNLLVASHKYQITSLQKQCSTILKSKVAVDTICEIIIFSDMVQDVELKEFALEYFKANAKCILQSAEWKQLLANNLKLATEILTECVMAK